MVRMYKRSMRTLSEIKIKISELESTNANRETIAVLKWVIGDGVEEIKTEAKVEN